MKALVTGGGGFIGGRIVEMLHKGGHDVTALGRGRYPHHERAGIPTVQVDLRDAGAVRRATAGKDVVFHVGGLTGIWGRRRDFWDINVTGTKHVIDACRGAGVGKLVFTSSPSVVFGAEEVCGADESLPYLDRYLAVYPETKAVAERMVLAANGPDLSTVALRPHLVWGPRDPNLLPRVVGKAELGQLIQVGDGQNLVDITYIDNVADAHLQAEASLSPEARCAGRAYFISNGDPVFLWSWFNEVLAAVGVPGVTRRISYGTASRIGAILEAVYRGLRIRREPRMTRFLAAQLAKSHYFTIEAARRDLGYEPKVSVAEGQKRLVVWLKEWMATKSKPGFVPPAL